MVTVQFPAFRVFSFEPDFVQTFFDFFATDIDTFAFAETVVMQVFVASDFAVCFFLMLSGVNAELHPTA
jgi:hypothetical protein